MPLKMNSFFCLRRPGGALFEKTAPVTHLDPLQKLFIKVTVICSLLYFFSFLSVASVAK
jgi:hypothetical protein